MKDEVDRKVIQQLARDLGLEPNEVRWAMVEPAMITVTVYEVGDKGEKRILDDGRLALHTHVVRVN